MTVQDAIRTTRTLKPNQYSDEDMTRWLSDLDGQVYRDVIVTHDHRRHRERRIYPTVYIWPHHHKKPHHKWPKKPEPQGVLPYFLPKDADRVLLITHPYEDVYIKYLSAQVDYHNGEFDRYNNAMMMFNTIYQAYVNWYNRAHVPRQDNVVVT